MLTIGFFIIVKSLGEELLAEQILLIFLVNLVFLLDIIFCKGVFFTIKKLLSNKKGNVAVRNKEKVEKKDSTKILPNIMTSQTPNSLTINMFANDNYNNVSILINIIKNNQTIKSFTIYEQKTIKNSTKEIINLTDIDLSDCVVDCKIVDCK